MSTLFSKPGGISTPRVSPPFHEHGGGCRHRQPDTCPLVAARVGSPRGVVYFLFRRRCRAAPVRNIHGHAGVPAHPCHPGNPSFPALPSVAPIREAFLRGALRFIPPFLRATGTRTTCASPQAAVVNLAGRIGAAVQQALWGTAWLVGSLLAACVAGASQRVLVLGAGALVLLRAGARALTCRNAPGCGSSSVL